MTIEPNARLALRLRRAAGSARADRVLPARVRSAGRRHPPPPLRRPSGNADELAGDALQALVDGDGQRALAAIARANLVAPKRPDLAWLHARICMLAPGCEPEPIETRLRKLAPDNGVVWLGPLARAQARHDRRVEDQILEAMSRAQRFDLYWTGLVWRLSTARDMRTRLRQALRRAEPQPLTHALDQTTEALSGAVVPAFRAAEHRVRAGSHAGARNAHALRAHRASHAAQRHDAGRGHRSSELRSDSRRLARPTHWCSTSAPRR